MDAVRALVAVAARSFAAVEDTVTLPQLRVLTMVDVRGPMGPGAVAASLGVHPSNATRACQRLVLAGLLTRREASHDRRNAEYALTPRGRRLVESVMAHRREAIARVLGRLSADRRELLAAAFAEFAEAAGEDEADHGMRLSWPG